MKTKLMYVVRNNYKDEDKKRQTSILGVYDDLLKAYNAAHIKAIQLKDSHPLHRMEIKVVPLNGTDYLGCSAYEFNFLEPKTELQIKLRQAVIENWWLWSDFNVEVMNPLPLKELLIEALSIKPFTADFSGEIFEAKDGEILINEKPSENERDLTFLAERIYDEDAEIYSTK